MKRVLKWLGMGLVVLVLAGIAAAVCVVWATDRRFARHFEVPRRAVPVPTSPAAVAEGRRLFVSRSCSDCHGDDLGGDEFLNDPAAGRFRGSNLTRGRGGVGGTYKDEDFERAIRHGVGPDGRALLFMPATDYYALSDADVGALIAYIRSVPPVDQLVPAQRPGPLMRVLFLAGKTPFLVSAEGIDHQAAPVAEVKPEVSVEFGRYMAHACTGCHGAGLSGGPIPGGSPRWPPATNMTPDPDTGLGKWSEAGFIKAVREGKNPSGREVRAPMPWRNFSLMTDTEVKALYLYLRSLPPKPLGGR